MPDTYATTPKSVIAAARKGATPRVTWPTTTRDVARSGEVLLDGAPLLPPASPEQDKIGVPDGYPLDRWADDASDVEWLFGVHPELRRFYAAIAQDDPRLDQARPTEISVAERAKGRNLSKRVVEAWPGVFTEPSPTHSGYEYRVGPEWGLHLARIRLAASLVQEEETRLAAAADSECQLCHTPYKHQYQAQGLCDRCDQTRIRLYRLLGEEAFADLGDGRTRLAAVLQHMFDPTRSN